MTEPGVVDSRPNAVPELLAPAGGMDAAYAAFHYGADAVYAGLKKFSARAEAENFTPDQLGELVAYAHSLTPRRRVFVTLNTVVVNAELPEVTEALATVADLGVDAVIVQDMGVVRIARECFPTLALHASTQMAVHNLAGVRALRQLGFRRVTLARELTAEEVGVISRDGGLETEVFIHGALCYSYSGLCLYSSLLRGRSGNRGRCSYPCRDIFQVTQGGAGPVLPFSMKDLAVSEDVRALRAAGASAFKIEGRKKSALYVAATVAYYRHILNGDKSPAALRELEAHIRMIFSRPWTSLYVKGRKNPDVCDTDTVGHRGMPVGRVAAVVRSGDRHRIRFVTDRKLERHDGLQVDLPGVGRPFGFPVDELLVVSAGRGRAEPVFEAPARSTVEVGLPPDHPEIPANTPVYCASSQEVKRSYPFDRPKPGEFKVRSPMDVVVTIEPAHVCAAATTGDGVRVEVAVDGPFQTGRNPGAMELHARGAFERLGETRLALGSFALRNPQGLFVPVSVLNRLRRTLCDEVARARTAGFTERVRLCAAKYGPGPAAAREAGAPRWAIKVDRVEYLAAFEAVDWNDVDDAIVEIGSVPDDVLTKGLADLAGRIGAERVRLALPIVTRQHEVEALTATVRTLRGAGWRRWQASNLSALDLLNTEQGSDMDLAADWPLYALNRVAVRQWFDLGVSQITLSPEDGFINMKELLSELGPRVTVAVYQDPPLFISETCAVANLSGGCLNGNQCPEERELVCGSREHVIVIRRNCRTILINRRPFSLVRWTRELQAAGACRFRADFVYRTYDPLQVLRTWRDVRAGRPPAAAQDKTVVEVA